MRASGYCRRRPPSGGGRAMGHHTEDTAGVPGTSPRAARCRPTRRATALAVGLLCPVLLAACGSDPGPAPAAASSDCPRTVTARLDGDQQPKRHDEYLVDLSGSGGASLDSLSPQIE